MGTTPATTTRAESAAVQGARVARWVLAPLSLAIAIALLYLGVPRFIAAALEAPHAGTVATAERGIELPADRLRDAIDDLESALGWRPSRATHINLAVLQQALAATLDQRSPAHRVAVDAALAHYRSGLALAPLAPLEWSQFGWLLAREGRMEEARRAVRFSTLIATHAPNLHWWRLELWLRLFRQLDEEDRHVMRRQLLLAFDRDPERTVRLATHYRLLYRVRGELAEAGVEDERLNAHFPIPLGTATRR